MEEAGGDGTFPRSHFSLPVFSLMVPERTMVVPERTMMDLAEVQEPSGWGHLPLERMCVCVDFLKQHQTS